MAHPPNPPVEPGADAAAGSDGVLVRDRDVARDRLVEVLGRAQRKITVFAPYLDPYLFNVAGVQQTIAQLVTHDRHARVRILLEDAGKFLQENARLMALCRRLSDFVLVRQVAETHQGVTKMFVLADRRAYLLQQDVAIPEWLVDLNGGRRLVDLATQFRELWADAEPLPGLHVTGLR